MKRRVALLALVVMAVTTACSRLGTGLPGCESSPQDPGAATVLSLQAVPSADYSPCLNNLPLGWEGVDFEVESGLVRLELEHGLESFLEVRLTPSCDIGSATEVPSNIDGISRFEDIDDVTATINVTIVPAGDRARFHALSMADELDGVRVEDRDVAFKVDDKITDSVLSRVKRALLTDDYVWIVGELDIDEGTLEMRATPEGEGRRGLDVDDALEVIGETAGEMAYEGQWFFVFEGGCITYDFEAEGRLALSVAEDAEETIGFYRNESLRQAAMRYGYEIDSE